jgi:hypothetical protein
VRERNRRSARERGRLQSLRMSGVWTQVVNQVPCP